jgi:hypothetical protein
LISYAYLASENVVAVDDDDDDALAMSSNKVVFLSVDDVDVVNARSTVLLFVVWEEDFVGFLRLAVFFFFFPPSSSPFALVVQLVGRGTAHISLSLSLSLFLSFEFSFKVRSKVR